MTPEELTDPWLSDVLGSEVRVVASSRIGDGLVGMNVRLELEGGDDTPPSLIAKLPSPDPTSRMTGVMLRNYEREVKFYSELAPSLDIRVARCYHHHWDPASGDFVLLLEDLAPGEQGNQITGCTVEQARTAVLELARLHGPRWGDPALDQIEWLTRRTSTADAEQLKGLWDMFVPDFLAIYRRYLDADQVAVVESFGSRIVSWVNDREPPATVTHGDYRLDNLMFASGRGGYPVAVVDWQTPGHGRASGDVAYFLGAGLLPEQRREVERPLVEEYASAVAGYGVAIDLEELWLQYRQDAYGGVVMSVVASQIVGASERSEAMFAAMATRHTQHVLDLDSESVV
jgi:hypothetical protein